MMPEPNGNDRFSTMSDRELLEYVARTLQRIEPLLDAMENPPPMAAAMMAGMGLPTFEG